MRQAINAGAHTWSSPVTQTADVLRVLIISADPLARAGLDALLAALDDVTPSGHIASVDELPAALSVYHPDALLWDCAWSPEPLSDTLLEIEAASGGPEERIGALPVVALAPDSEQAQSLWRAGQRAVLTRSVDPATLAAAFRAAAAGLCVLSPHFADDIPAVRSEALSAPIEPLTEREREVLQLMAEGLANRAIARRLDISEHTVKFHANAIFGKLDVQSRTEAVVRATRAGLIHI